MNRLIKISLAIAAILLLASFGFKNEKAEKETTCCVLCKADLFEEPYTKLEKEVKNGLKASGCTISNDSIAADYVVRIETAAREYNQDTIAETAFYCAYVDATLSIEKSGTEQRFYEDEISAKGVHTVNYIEAAREAYGSISKDIVAILKERLGMCK